MHVTQVDTVTVLGRDTLTISPLWVCSHGLLRRLIMECQGFCCITNIYIYEVHTPTWHFLVCIHIPL